MEPYGVGFEESFNKAFKALGGKVLESVRYDPTATSFDSVVEKVAAKNPDFVMLCAYPETGSAILKAAYEEGFMENIDWLLSEALRDDKLAEMVGKDKAGRYIIAGLKGTTPDPRVAGPACEAFKRNYTAEYGREPIQFCSNSYDAMAVVALAIEKAGSTSGTAIRNSLREVTRPPGKKVTDIGEALRLIREGLWDINYQGASGDLHFDENGDEWENTVNGPLQIMEVSCLEILLRWRARLQCQHLQHQQLHQRQPSYQHQRQHHHQVQRQCQHQQLHQRQPSYQRQHRHHQALKLFLLLLVYLQLRI